MRPVALFGLGMLVAACKPPPTDADLSRDMPTSAPSYASDPLPSPDTEGAVWAQSSDADRIIYGIPGEPALVSLACLNKGSPAARMRIARLAPADADAGALLALIGNGHIGRLEVDATEVNGRSVWLGESLAVDLVWEPLNGPRQATVTVPGAGMVTLNPSEMPWELLSACRGIPEEIDPPEELKPETTEPVLPPIP